MWAAGRPAMRGAARGGWAKAPSGLPGPAGRGRRSHFEFRYRQSWAADAGARLHLDFLCDSGAGHEGCGEETARHVWVTGGCLAFPSNKPGDVCTKNMPRAAVCCPLRGKFCAWARERSFFCVATDVSRRIVPGLLSGKGALPAQTGCPLQDLGAFPRLILSLPVARTRLLSSIPRQVAQNPMHSAKVAKAPKPGAAIVERIAVEPQNCSKYQTHSL